MQERLSGTYDVLAIGHDTRKNLLENKDSLLPYELVISSDTGDLLYKDEQGNLSGFFGATGDINDQIKEQVDNNTIANQANFEAIAVNTKHIDDLKHDKLDKGLYVGNAENLNMDIVSNKNKIEELKIGKLDKGNFTGTADDLLSKSGGEIVSDSPSPLALKRNGENRNLSITFDMLGKKKYLGLQDGEVLVFSNEVDLAKGTKIPTDKEQLIYGDGYTGTVNLGNKDLNSINKSGFYRADTDSANGIVGHISQLIHFQNPKADNYSFQINASASGNGLHFRKNYGGVWSGWSNMWTDMSTLFSKENNGYVRFPNGLQICWGGIAAETTSISFPIAFSSPALRCFILPGNNGNTLTSTPIDWSHTATVSITNTGAKLFAKTSSVTRTYLAIGY